MATLEKSGSKGRVGGAKRRGATLAKSAAMTVIPDVGKRAPKVGKLTLYTRMGRLLGERIESERDLVRIVGVGLPSTALDRLIDEIDIDVRLIGPETTVRRRMQNKQQFTVDESERLVRLARITSMAEELFGDTQAAAAWLRAQTNYLPDSEPISPLELSQTDSGARLVEGLMLQTAHGIF
ncbi:MAG TPA: hypothetical protein VM240_01280 [Verrucomicrobiae bacterium]|nr:hypothetical protein [Verrucomicrobiae bacterium]